MASVSADLMACSMASPAVLAKPRAAPQPSRTTERLPSSDHTVIRTLAKKADTTLPFSGLSGSVISTGSCSGSISHRLARPVAEAEDVVGLLEDLPALDIAHGLAVRPLARLDVGGVERVLQSLTWLWVNISRILLCAFAHPHR